MNEDHRAELDGLVLRDDFADDVPTGRVGAGGTTAWPARRAVDTEGVIGVDHGAARFRPLRVPGWGRCALLYDGVGPRCGRSVLVHVLNGHNGSEAAEEWPGVPNLLYNHVLNTRDEPGLRRLLSSPGAARVRLRDQVPRVLAHRRARAAGEELDQSLAAGWLGGALTGGGLGGGHGFVVRAREAVNGDLCASVHGHLVPVRTELPNLPLALVTVLRERGALLGVVEDHGEGPELWPVAVDTDVAAGDPRPGVHQAVSGQIGWRVDTRLLRVAVADPAALAGWATTAALADRLVGERPLSEGEPGAGPYDDHAGVEFRIVCGAARRTGTGVAGPDAVAGADVVALAGRVDASVVHVVAGDGGSGGLVVRADAAGNGFYVWWDGAEVRIERRDGESVVEHARCAAPRPSRPGSARSLQVLDDGARLCVVVDGVVTGQVALADAVPTTSGRRAPLDGPDHVGLAGSPSCPLRGLRDLEVHPRRMPVPLGLRPRPIPVARATALVVADAFDTDPGPLHGRAASDGSHWARTVGTVPFVVAASAGSDGRRAGARVPAPPDEPRRWRRARAFVGTTGRRTAYTVPWSEPRGAAIEAGILPPGDGPGEGERCRAGLVLWQDPANWIIAATWLDDAYPGTSVSTFYRLDDREELYEAVWTNVGRRITWGRPYRLGVRYAAGTLEVDLDGEAVLRRSVNDVCDRFTDLAVTRVGIATNWEFGDDTGSVFGWFRASSVRVGSTPAGRPPLTRARAS